MVRRMLVGGVVLAVIAPAAAAGAASRDPRAGIQHARNAGISVDPAAEAAMAAAPIGTCANDPTLRRCPAAHAVIAVRPDANGNYTLAALPSALADSATRTLLLAPNNCNDNVSSPYKAAGYAQGDARNDCYSTPPVERQEIYGQLYKLYKGVWHQMQADSDGLNSNGRVDIHPRYKCTATVRRSWNFTVNTYVLWQGTWYATPTRSTNESLNCG
jgi:hypothetical protein